MLILVVIIFSNCTNSSEKGSATDTANHLFTLLPSSQTHVDFTNSLTEGLNTNVLIYEYFYNGGGVAVGDVNGEALS